MPNKRTFKKFLGSSCTGFIAVSLGVGLAQAQPSGKQEAYAGVASAPHDRLRAMREDVQHQSVQSKEERLITFPEQTMPSVTRSINNSSQAMTPQPPLWRPLTPSEKRELRRDVIEAAHKP